ncbi:MAG: C45 family autoproteolytic acyltransferase/hydrolase [Planctomycetota bacterium]
MPTSSRRLSFVLLAALAAAVLPWVALRAEEPGAAVAEAVRVTGRLEKRGPQTVLTLWGTPRERGFAHGYLLADSLLAGAEHDFGQLLKPFLPMYEGFVRGKIVPNFALDAREREEVEGLIEGLKAKRGEDGVRVEALGRAFDITDLIALNTFGDWYGMGCSSLAVWGRHSKDGTPRVGRNFDFPAFDLVTDHGLVVVRAPDGEYAGSVAVTYPGCIGLLTGQSERGVFVSVHDVPVRAPTAQLRPGNVPRLLALRRLLERVQGDTPTTQARTLLAAWPTMYGNNLMVMAGHAKEGEPLAAVMEYDGREDVHDGVTQRTPEPGVPALEGGTDPLIACTNDHLLRDGLARSGPTQCWRYPLLIEGAHGDKPLAFDVATLFDRMGRASFPRGEGNLERAAGVMGVKRTNGFGTLHQVVGEPALGHLHIRMARLGSRVEKEPAIDYDVPAVVKAAAPADDQASR